MPTAPRYITRYGLRFPTSYTDLDICLECIRKGGQWKSPTTGATLGAPLAVLYRAMQSYLWPDDDHHPWSDLMLDTILAQRITVVQGPKDCSKTHTIAKFALTDYFSFPDNTLILMSSTDIRGLELRVWGDLKDLFQRAKQVWPEAPGYPMDSLHGIFTDRLDETSNLRDMRKGIICIPCLESGGQWKGLEKYTGIKQKRRRLLGDEVQFMELPYLTSLANLNKRDFKGVFVGNPTSDPLYALDRLAEPIGGWDSLGEVTKTDTWPNKMGGITIQLYGPDSPAITSPGKYPYLIDEKDIDYIVKFWGKDTAEYWNQAAGIRSSNVSLRRVLTRDMAVQFRAQTEVIWKGTPTTKVIGIDAAYGGDRCVAVPLEFGLDIDGTQVAAFEEPIIVPVVVYPSTVPVEERTIAEDQIANFIKAMGERLDVPPQNVFFDATGRGSLGTAFARVWSAAVNPVESGGNPTRRPVCSDLFILDDKTKQRRLKRADEHYSKLVTEYWFSLRYAVEGQQIRQLPNSVLDELCAREWTLVRGDRRELEAKDDTKKRLGRSPDMADAATFALEGARRLGFVISRLETLSAHEEDGTWRYDLRRQASALRQSYALDYKA